MNCTGLLYFNVSSKNTGRVLFVDKKNTVDDTWACYLLLPGLVFLSQ